MTDFDEFKESLAALSDFDRLEQILYRHLIGVWRLLSDGPEGVSASAGAAILQEFHELLIPLRSVLFGKREIQERLSLATPTAVRFGGLIVPTYMEAAYFTLRRIKNVAIEEIRNATAKELPYTDDDFAAVWPTILERMQQLADADAVFELILNMQKEFARARASTSRVRPSQPTRKLTETEHAIVKVLDAANGYMTGQQIVDTLIAEPETSTFREGTIRKALQDLSIMQVIANKTGRDGGYYVL